MRPTPSTILAERRFAGSVTPAEIRRVHAVVASADQVLEARQRRWFIAFIVAIVATVVSLLVTILAERAVSVIPFAVAIFACILIGHRYFRAKRRNLDDRRYDVLHRLARLLECDLAPESNIAVDLDLTPADTSAKFVRKGTIGPWNVKFYDDPWLRLRGRFADGTRFAIEVTERTQHRSRWKRSSSGKMKHKSKTKRALRTRVALRPRSSRYPKLDAQRDQAMDRLDLPPGTTARGIHFRKGWLTLKAGTKVTWSGDGSSGVNATELIASMLLSLYRTLHLSRKAASS